MARTSSIGMPSNRTMAAFSMPRSCQCSTISRFF
jgi:hypothetical protein